MLSNYLEIGGLFEIKKGRQYDIFNNLNEDSFTYKSYNKILKMNDQQMMELQFNISDAVLLGSGSSIHLTEEILNKY